jgi:hypothetical protein
MRKTSIEGSGGVVFIFITVLLIRFNKNYQHDATKLIFFAIRTKKTTVFPVDGANSTHATMCRN